MSHRRARNTNCMQKCCYEGTCFDNFKDLPQRIENLNGKPLFDYMHESPSGMIINKVPKATEWNDFLYDYWDYTSKLDFEDEFTTTIDVNRFGNDKVFINWRCLDHYKGHYNSDDR